MKRRTSIWYPLLGTFVIASILVSGVFAEETEARLEITGQVEQASVRLGDSLSIVVTLKNIGKREFSIAPSRLHLSPDSWSAWGRGGSSWGTVIALSSDEADGGPILLLPDQNTTLSGLERDITSVTLGPMEIHYVLRSMDLEMLKILPKPNNARITLSIEVLPTEFMSNVWNARQIHKRADLQEQVRRLLRLRAAAKERRQRDFVECNFRYMAGHAEGLLEVASNDTDPVIRSQAVEAYHYTAWAVGSMNHYLDQFNKDRKLPEWAKNIKRADEKAAKEACVRIATAGLKDDDPRVRLSAVNVLTYRSAQSALEDIKKLATDQEDTVRSAALDYLSKFAAEPLVAETILDSLSDPSDKVREKTLYALEKSPQPPPVSALKRAFLSTKGSIALRLLALLFEQEDLALPPVLLPDFKDRSTEEQLAILTAIAGHRDTASVEIVKLGLENNNAAVQHTALMRLLAFRKDVSLPLVQECSQRMPEALRNVAQDVQIELIQRRLFPFLGEAHGSQIAALETAFPSENGTQPMVSPDGRWIAYVETGWGRPGGSGGTGRSNLISLVHAIQSNGHGDRIISDMFLVCWLSDSQRIASARDGHAAVCNLDGEVVSEFGQLLDRKRQKYADQRSDWLKGPFRKQFGTSMPHRKRLTGLWQHDYGENATFSPDGNWFGPVPGKLGIAFVDPNGQRIDISVPERSFVEQKQATWSPGARYVAIMPIWASTGLIIDMENKDSQLIRNLDPMPTLGGREYRKCRWNPWAKDSSHLAFVREGQVWICAPDGGAAKQLTFDSTRKAFPTFSRNGKRLAYITWQADDRRHYKRMGPTDLWVVDIKTTLAARVTAPSKGRINCLDWLDDNLLIFDRIEPDSHYQSSLRCLAMNESNEQQQRE